MPDSSESRERADPSKEAGLGQMSENKTGPVNKPEQHDKNREQSERHRERSADELTDQSEAVSPTEHEAPRGRRKGLGNEARSRGSGA